MKSPVDKVLKEIIVYDFPISERPYKEIAEKIGISEEELIDILRYLQKEGIIRRVAAILYHRKAFYTHNAMVVWKVEEKDIERVGKIMASFPEVSHCYERDTGGYWDYNVYTMVHGKSMEECRGVIKRISKKIGIKVFKMFLSKREFKKTSLMVNHE